MKYLELIVESHTARQAFYHWATDPACHYSLNGKLVSVIYEANWAIKVNSDI